MTPKEKAQWIIDHYRHIGPEDSQAIMSDIEAAIEEEREACAKIADQYWTQPEKQEGCDMCEVGHSISEEIRARGRS
jgi:hypothetical protein